MFLVNNLYFNDFLYLMTITGVSVSEHYVPDQTNASSLPLWIQEHSRHEYYTSVPYLQCYIWPLTQPMCTFKAYHSPTYEIFAMNYSGFSLVN